MRPAWTPDQRRAIETHDQSLLVSAAAGSGKTAVLAERCAYLVCDAPDPCGVDELLVVTFTNAAADEMKRRIGKVIAERAAKSDDARLQRQALLVSAAQISTIHSLASAIIRRHFHELGIEPNFRLLDEEEAKLMRLEIAERLLEERLDDGTDAEFRKLVAAYAPKPSDLAKVLLQLHARLASVLDQDEWLEERRAWIAEAIDKPLKESRIGKAALHEQITALESHYSACRRLRQAVAQMEDLEKYVDYLHEIEVELGDSLSHLQREPWDLASQRLRAFEFNRLPIPKGPQKLAAQARINALKKAISNFLDNGLFCFTEQQLRDGLKNTIWVTDQMTRLVSDFETAYQKAKRDAGALDFNDLERFTLKLLREPGSRPAAPSRIAKEYQAQFRHVLIDEYQDVNEVQDTILSLISRPANHFCVGDVKQSIYRFRQADPQRFLRRYARYEQDKSAGAIVDLQKNFRSRGPLLDVLNGVFECLMTEPAAEVEYDARHQLVPGAEMPEAPELFAGAPVELHIVAESKEDLESPVLESGEHESVVAAMRIRALLGHDGNRRARVVDRGGATRPIEPRDIVVLLRTMRVKAEVYSAIFRRCGIPVQADSTTGFFASTEIGDLIDLLKLLNNSRNDVALAALLRSPLVGWENAEGKMLRIRQAFPTSKARCFHQSFQMYANHRKDELAGQVGETIATLSRWREMAQVKPLSTLLWNIIQETAFIPYISGLPDGEQRVANVMSLHQRAKDFETFQTPTVGRFLRYLESIQEEGDLGMPAAAGVAQNAVRVMSVHKSKGLEFPVVIVPDLGKQHNLRDGSARLLMDDSVGIAARVVDTDREIHYASLATQVASTEMRRKSLAEELRVLYVAGTRAREHLILIGCAKEDCFDEWRATWSGHSGPIDAGTVLLGSNSLAWIGPAATIVESRKPGSFATQLHLTADLDKVYASMKQTLKTDEVSRAITELKPLPKPTRISEAPRAEAVVARLEQAYPHEAMSRLPAATSVTSSTKSGRVAPGGSGFAQQPPVPFDHLLETPRFLASSSKLSGADVGSITHTVLQHLDFQQPCDRSNLLSQIDALVIRRLLRKDDATQVDLAAIEWFLATPLAARMRACGPKLLREFDITYTAQPSPDDLQLVRGRIDAVLVEPEGLTVIDYKTDRVTEQTVLNRAEFYQPQVEAYRAQLQRISQRPVLETVLIFLHPRTMHTIRGNP